MNKNKCWRFKRQIVICLAKLIKKEDTNIRNKKGVTVSHTVEIKLLTKLNEKNILEKCNWPKLT